jgi:hypothetical protein
MSISKANPTAPMAMPALAPVLRPLELLEKTAPALAAELVTVVAPGVAELDVDVAPAVEVADNVGPAAVPIPTPEEIGLRPIGSAALAVIIDGTGAL